VQLRANYNGCFIYSRISRFKVLTNRGRYLINWLENSLLKLKHPNDERVPLVKIYGPKIRFDRGPALAFNVYDWKSEKDDSLNLFWYRNFLIEIIYLPAMVSESYLVCI
jgi:hypothetical protein